MNVPSISGTQGSPQALLAIFVIGRPGQPASLAGDTLYVDAPDTYIGLAQKIWAAVRESLLLFNFDWLFKADDDTWINPLRLASYPRTRDYIGKPVALHGKDPAWEYRVASRRELIGSVQAMAEAECTPYRGPWAGGGVGYFLSHRAAKLLAEEPFEHVRREIYEDKFTGDVMRSYGIYPHGQHDTLRALTEKPFGWQQRIHGATTLHPCAPDRMREVYWRLHRAGEIGT